MGILAGHLIWIREEDFVVVSERKECEEKVLEQKVEIQKLWASN